MLPAGEPILSQASEQLDSWLGKTASRWWFPAVIGTAVLAFAVRCLRLANPNYYHVYSPDSYFFDWIGQRVMAGEGIYHLHSGLAYPLAHIAKALSYMFNISSEESFALAAKFLPPALAVITLIVIYLGVSRIWNRRVALFSALTWALLTSAILFGVGGFLDRDGLSVLLLLTGALVFLLFKDYHAHVGSMNVGWLLAGLSVVAVQGLLYLEWGFSGVILLIAVLLIYAAVKFLLLYFAQSDTEPNTRVKFSTLLKGPEWRALGLIAGVNIVFLLLYSNNVSGWFTLIWDMVRTRSGGRPVGLEAAELTGLSFSDLIAFQFFLVPIALGLYSAWKKRDDASVFFSGWFVSFAILSLLASRVLVYAVPAACIIAALGFDYLWEWRRRGTEPLLRTLGVVVLLILMLVFSLMGALSMNASPGMAADKNWQDALAYLREETPQNSVVMSQWSWGYWILDLGQRTPFVDNGYRGYNADMLQDVALAYLATDPAEARQIMARHGTEYLVFSNDDLDVAEPIMKWAGIENQDTFPADSLIVRSLNGEFVSGGGLEIKYQNDEVVILGLTGHQGS